MIHLCCQHPACFARVTLGRYEPEPTTCPECGKKARWSAHWEPDPETPPFVPGEVHEHPYELTRKDWIELKVDRIAPEIAYDEAL